MKLINFLMNNPCQDPNILKVILFIRKIMEVAFIAIPIVLIVLITFDFVKSVMAGTEDNMKKNQKIVIKRLFYAVMVFFVLPIVNIVFGAFTSSEQADLIGEEFGDETVNYLTCWTNADSIETINSFIVKVKFDGNGGNVYGESVKTCGGKEVCEIANLPRVSKNAQEFTGWSKTSDCSGAKITGNSVFVKNTILQNEKDQEIYDETYYACFGEKTNDSSDNKQSNESKPADIDLELSSVKYEDNKQITSYYDKTNKKVYLYRCPNDYYVTSSTNAQRVTTYSCKKKESDGTYSNSSISKIIIPKYAQGNYSDNSACGGGTLVKKGCLPTSGAMIFSALQNKTDLTPSDMNNTAKVMKQNGYNVCKGNSYYVEFLLDYAQDNGIGYNTFYAKDYTKIIDFMKSKNTVGVAPLSSKGACYNDVKKFCYTTGHFVIFFAADNLDSGYVNVIDPGKSASPIYNVSLNDLVLSTQSDMVRLFYN